MPAAATCATQPAASAAGGLTAVRPTAAMPANWVTDINGDSGEVESQTGHGDAREMQRTDRKQGELRAYRGREQTGSGGPPESGRPRGSPPSPSAHAISRGTPIRRPAVAPKVSWNPGSTSERGSAATRHAAARASVFSGSVRWSTARAARNTTAANTARVTDASGATTWA